MNFDRYIRQTTLNEVGENGQGKLANTKVLVVGCGGLGSEVAVHLAASGIGAIHLIDFDRIELTNLHRQVFYKEVDIGKHKAEILFKYISKINSQVNASFSTNKIEKHNIRNIISVFDFVIDCTDNLHTKYLINDACVLENKILIYGSLHKFEGHVAVFNSKDLNGQRTANLRDVFPEIPTENIPTCSEVGTLNPVVSIIANLQVNELLKLVLCIGETLVNKLLIYNVLENSQLKLKLKVNFDLCFISIWSLFNYVNDKILLCQANEINIEEFRENVKNKSIKIISVIDEDITLDFKVDFYLPFSSFNIEETFLDLDDYVVVCKGGITSLKVVELLKLKYPNYNIKSLQGGILSK